VPTHPFLDWLALVAWLTMWLGYQWFALKPRFGRQSLTSTMVPIRRSWMVEALHRENRISDASLIGNLMNSATFFSSTTLLILGGLFAFISSLDKNAAFVSALPFAEATTLRGLEFKSVILAFVFIYALFRFLWSIRQFNLLTILLGAYPAAPAKPTTASHFASARWAGPPLQIVDQATQLNALAGHNFTQALRAYYYAVPILLWLINPWLLIGGSVVVTSAVYFTEYRSGTARALTAQVAAAPSSPTPPSPRHAASSGDAPLQQPGSDP
jgi:uncharacterized membrane protein